MMFKGVKNIEDLIKESEMDKQIPIEIEVIELDNLDDIINKDNIQDEVTESNNKWMPKKHRDRKEICQKLTMKDELMRNSAINLLKTSKKVKLTSNIKNALIKVNKNRYNIKIAGIDISWVVEMRDGVPWLKRVSKTTLEDGYNDKQ